MPNLYIIAGPPGIGKSHSGKVYAPTHLKILNHDILKSYLKNKKIFDYESQSNIKIWELINENILLNIDFGIELNLGFDSQYGFLKQIIKNHPQYSIRIILFFTDDIEICLERALMRQKNGGHTVLPVVIKEMYANTLNLFKENRGLFNHIQFVNVSDLNTNLVYSGNSINQRIEFVGDNLPNWLSRNFPEIQKPTYFLFLRT